MVVTDSSTPLIATVTRTPGGGGGIVEEGRGYLEGGTNETWVERPCELDCLVKNAQHTRAHIWHSGPAQAKARFEHT